MPARHAVLSTHSVSSRPTQLHSSSQSAYESPQFPVFVFKRLRTLSFSVSRKSCVCHSLVPSGAEGYEKCRVCTNNSHSGTCGSPVIARKRLKFFLFKFLRTLLHFLALSENSTLFVSNDSTLFAQNTRGCGEGGAFLRIRRGMRTPRSAAPSVVCDSRLVGTRGFSNIVLPASCSQF